MAALTKEDGVCRRTDLFYVDPRVIRVVDGWNPRTIFLRIEELRDSIIEEGVTDPIKIHKNKDGGLDLVDGERRLRATMMAIKEGHDIKSVPVIVAKKKTSEIDLYTQAMIANTGEPLEAIDEANGIKRLRAWGVSVKDIAKKVVRSETHVRNRLELANASPGVKEAVNKGEITVKAAQEIARESEGKVDAQTDALERKKAELPARKRPKPLTLFIKSGEVRKRGGKKDQDCQPLVEFLTNKDLRDKIKAEGFDPDSVKVSVTKIQDKTIVERQEELPFKGVEGGNDAETIVGKIKEWPKNQTN